MTHTCAVDANHRAWCWGFGRTGQIGDGNLFNRFTPRTVRDRHPFRRVNAGDGHTCAETTDGVPYCWGLNNFGQVGLGATSAPILRPTKVTGGFHFAQVTAGGDHSCGRTSDDVARCWGRNSDGQLGDGTTTDRSAPTLVAGPS